MTTGQAILIGFSVVAVSVTYFFAPLHPPKSKTAEHTAAISAKADFDIDAYIEEELNKLPELKAQYEQYEGQRKYGDSALPTKSQYDSLASALENHQQHILAAFMRQHATYVSPQTDSIYADAARRLYAAAFTTDNQSLTQYVISEAIKCYEKALELNPDNADVKMEMAVAYLEGQTEPMKGVMILREITDKDPDNITANLILGKYGIVSGQFDKAAERLNKVLSVDSLNVDAYLYLAQAYEGMGDKAKAIAALEKCRNLVQDSGFSENISKYIEKLKNS